MVAEPAHFVQSSKVCSGRSFEGSTIAVAIRQRDLRWAALDFVETEAFQCLRWSVDGQTVVRNLRPDHSTVSAAPVSNRLETLHSIFALTIASVCRRPH